VTRRAEPVIVLSERVEPGPVRRIMDVLQALLGKVESFADVLLFHNLAGYQVVDAVASPGTAIGGTRVSIHFGDAGTDQVRLVARAKNSAAGTVILQLYDVTNTRALAVLTVSGVTETIYTGEYVDTLPTGNEHELELRVIGDGAFDPTLYRVSCQLRTVQARA
jgi:hypothetical protein